MVRRRHRDILGGHSQFLEVFAFCKIRFVDGLSRDPFDTLVSFCSSSRAADTQFYSSGVHLSHPQSPVKTRFLFLGIHSLVGTQSGHTTDPQARLMAATREDSAQASGRLHRDGGQVESIKV